MRGIVIATVLALAFLVAPADVVVAAASPAPANSSHNRGPVNPVNDDNKKEDPQRKKGESNKLARGVLCRARVIITAHRSRPLWTDPDAHPSIAPDEPKRIEHLRRLLTPPALQVFRN